MFLYFSIISITLTKLSSEAKDQDMNKKIQEEEKSQDAENKMKNK